MIIIIDYKIIRCKVLMVRSE